MEANNKSSSIIPREPIIKILPGELAEAGHAANQAAASHRIENYQMRRAAQTLRRQHSDLALFREFLHSINLNVGDLFTDPQAWEGVTWGLVEAFIQWQLKIGYALTTINVRFSTIKAYARLVMQAGVLQPQEYALIRSIKNYTHKEQRRIDQKRPKTRLGPKKPDPVIISQGQARALKSQPNTPQGRRDALMMCLLLDHGLRVGELAAIKVDNIDINRGLLKFFRPKIGKEQIHRLSRDSLKAVRAYMNFADMPNNGPLLRRSKKDESLSDAGMSDRAITQRVNFLGKKQGLSGLSAHDCRHYWATSAARHGTDPFSLQEAGGWASLAMPRRYVEQNAIANEGIILQNDEEDEE
jgi:integrase